MTVLTFAQWWAAEGSKQVHVEAIEYGWRGAAQVGFEAGMRNVGMVSIEQHADDAAVDRFALTMKVKLAVSREKGRSGWDNPEKCDVQDLAEMMLKHLPKGDVVDIANFCMMLSQRGAQRVLVAEAVRQFLAAHRDAGIEAAANLCLLEAKRNADALMDPSCENFEDFEQGGDNSAALAAAILRLKS